MADAVGRLWREHHASAGQVLLVRPDRYVAAVLPPAQEHAVARALRRTLGAPRLAAGVAVATLQGGPDVLGI